MIILFDLLLFVLFLAKRLSFFRVAVLPLTGHFRLLSVAEAPFIFISFFVCVVETEHAPSETTH